MSPSTNGHAPEDHGRHDSVNMENDEQNQVATYWSRFEHVKYGDVMKNILIEVGGILARDLRWSLK